MLCYGVVVQLSFYDPKNFIDMQDDLVLFANQSCSIFWSGVIADDTTLPGAVKGKLGGPSQRRLSISATTTVLQAVGTF